LFAVGVVCASAGGSPIIDFEDVALGRTFGALDNQTSGELVLSRNGIDVRVEDFFFGPSVVPGFAEVGGIFDPQFPTTPLSIDNLNLRFEFANVGFPVTQVSFEFVEFGGLDNFSVNDSPLIQLSPLTGLPVNIAPGVTVEVDDRTVTLQGAIDSFVVGGQELGIDNIIAVPEPATLALLALGGFGICLRFRRKKS